MEVLRMQYESERIEYKLSETSGFNAGSCFSISETIRWKAKSWS